MMQRLRENWQYKLLAVGLAVLIWLSAWGTDEITVSVSVPVQYRNLPKDLELSSDVRERVHLEIRGPSHRLIGETMATIVVSLDLAPVKRAGERTFPIDASTALLPAGVHLDRSVPAQVRLQFERRMAKQVPVSVRFGAPPPQGYEVASHSVEPGELQIVGPQSRVEVVHSVETDPVDLSEVLDGGQISVQAYAPDPQVRFAGSARVMVRVNVRKTGSSDN